MMGVHGSKCSTNSGGTPSSTRRTYEPGGKPTTSARPTSTAARTAPIYLHSGQDLVSTVEPGRLGIPVLKHIHHVHPHYAPDGTLYLLVHGWRDGKYAVLRHTCERTSE